MSDDLLEFLVARLAEDEAAANAAASPALPDAGWTALDHADHGSIVVDSDWDLVAVARPERSYDSAVATHIGRHDPARVLREVEAKRAILAQWGASPQDSLVLTFAIYCVASAHSDHPDYRPEWKP